jgi:hypothetical protein
MHQNRAGERPLCDAADGDLAVGELERLAQVDALLRLVAARDHSDAAARIQDELRSTRRQAK